MCVLNLHFQMSPMLTWNLSLQNKIIFLFLFLFSRFKKISQKTTTFAVSGPHDDDYTEMNLKDQLLNSHGERATL